jgi:hypothetical protein
MGGKSRRRLFGDRVRGAKVHAQHAREQATKAAREADAAETRASLPLDTIRRPGDTPIWKLESAFRCRSCGTPRYRAPVHMIRLTKEQSIAPYVWTHPDDERRGGARVALGTSVGAIEAISDLEE